MESNEAKKDLLKSLRVLSEEKKRLELNLAFGRDVAQSRELITSIDTVLCFILETLLVVL